MCPVGTGANVLAEPGASALGAASGGGTTDLAHRNQDGGNHVPTVCGAGGDETSAVVPRGWRSPTRYLVVFRNALIGVADSERGFATAAETGAERRVVDAGSAFRADAGGAR
jgi:hypothetical protein